MAEKKQDNQFLLRVIVPAYPEVNIYSRIAKKTTALGPIMIATSANELSGCRVKVTDENNFKGPRGKDGLPDHRALQKEDKASVVAVYCGLSSTIERAWETASFYHRQGVFVIAGGLHAHNCPEETLNHDFDIVVHGDGDVVIQQILLAFEEKNFENIPGVSYLEEGQFKRNGPKRNEILNLDSLPFPNFGLLEYNNKIKTYPISRIRGCNEGCEYCGVRGKVRFASPKHLFDTVGWLVKTRKAKSFFIVDDNSNADHEGTKEFFEMILTKYKRLKFAVQERLDDAEDIGFLKLMKKAGVRIVCIGAESPIDEELEAMKKGYDSSQMLKWLKIWRSLFWTHVMFIFGYPLKEKVTLINARERFILWKRFIRKASPDSVQILLPIPLVGTRLRKRIMNRIFPKIQWKKYDGNFPCFEPKNMTLKELQEMHIKLMSRFYNPWSIFRIPLKIITLPLHSLFLGWEDWHRGWDGIITKYGGYLTIKKWKKHNLKK
ncbi:B12-binding domain-containing radical SAM protein [Patescibacteria group bacterium]|nr:B12-binding domain-containing radical SAM protein [Patescibacteria group bacterium]